MVKLSFVGSVENPRAYYILSVGKASFERKSRTWLQTLIQPLFSKGDTYTFSVPIGLYTKDTPHSQATFRVLDTELENVVMRKDTPVTNIGAGQMIVINFELCIINPWEFNPLRLIGKVLLEMPSVLPDFSLLPSLEPEQSSL